MLFTLLFFYASLLFFDNNNNNNDIVTIINLLPLKSDWQRRAELLGNKSGGGVPYITDGDVRRNLQKKPQKVTILGVALVNFYSLKVISEIFIHRNNTGILKIIAKRQQVLLQMNEY